MKGKEIEPSDIQLGNLIMCFSGVEMVTGIIPQGKGWFIEHSGRNQQNNPLPNDVQFSCHGIPLTDEWKKCIRVDKYKFPEWVEYVHQAQNYMKWYANVDLLGEIDWKILPTN